MATSLPAECRCWLFLMFCQVFFSHKSHFVPCRYSGVKGASAVTPNLDILHNISALRNAIWKVFCYKTLFCKVLEHVAHYF